MKSSGAWVPNAQTRIDELWTSHCFLVNRLLKRSALFGLHYPREPVQASIEVLPSANSLALVPGISSCKDATDPSLLAPTDTNFLPTSSATKLGAK